VKPLPGPARQRLIRLLTQTADGLALASLWPAARLVPPRLAGPYVERLSRLVRATPVNVLKTGFVTHSLLLAGRRFDFAFETNTGLRWTASAFPDLLTRHLMFEGTYQQDVLVALTALIRPGDTVFDVGGHHGLMAAVSGVAAGDGGCVVTFEPNPYARRSLVANLAMNEVHNVIVEELAVTDDDGTHAFHIQKGDVTWNSSLVGEAGRNERFEETIVVPTSSLDAYVERTGRVPSVIKIDAEGAEFLVLRGAEQTLRRHRPILIMEFDPGAAREAGRTVRDYVDYLEAESYTLTVLRRDRRGYYHFELQEPFDEARHATEERLANVVCRPRQSGPAS